jgi:hypothetical protein
VNPTFLGQVGYLNQMFRKRFEVELNSEGVERIWCQSLEQRE